MERKNFKTRSGGGTHSLLLSFLIAMAMALCSAGGAWAKNVQPGHPYAVFDKSSGTLTFICNKSNSEGPKYTAGEVFMLWDNKDGGTGTDDYTKNKKSLKDKIKSIVFDMTMKDFDIEDFNAKEKDGKGNPGTLKVRNLFNDLPKLTSIYMGGTGTLKDYYFNLSNVTDLSELFRGCSSLKTIDFLTECLSKAKKVTNVSSMFNGCSSLEEVDLSTLDVSKVTTFSYMFNSCSKLKKYYRFRKLAE